MNDYLSRRTQQWHDYLDNYHLAHDETVVPCAACQGMRQECTLCLSTGFIDMYKYFEYLDEKEDKCKKEEI